MTISATTPNVNVYPQPTEFSALGPDAGVKIFEKVMQSGKQEAMQSGLPLTPKEFVRASARALAHLHSVSKEFRK